MSSQLKWVMVTGATSGIGLATAITLAVAGYEVIATGRSVEKLRIVEEAAKRANVTIRRVLLDVTDPESIETMASEVLALTDGYGVDVLVNNAGYGEGGAIEDIPIDRLRRQFETNVIGLVAVTQALLPFMRKRKFGRIVNISSVVGKITIPLMGAYTASKHAVESISDALRMELASSGIQVSIVAPGAIESNFGKTLTDTIAGWMKPDSPYAAAYAKMRTDRTKPGGAPASVIANAVLTAVRDENPRPRYAVTVESKLAPAVTSIVPRRTLDSILRRFTMGTKR